MAPPTHQARPRRPRPAPGTPPAAPLMFGPASSGRGSARRPRPAPAARPGGVSPRSARRAPGSEVRSPGSPPPGPAPHPRAPRPAPPRAERTMPQLDSGGGGASGGDDLGAPDELLAFQDEGEEQDDKSRDSAVGPERDLAELKSSLVNESEGAAGDAGVPGAGARARGEAEVGAEVSASPRPAAPPRPPRSAAPPAAPGARLALPCPSLPRPSGITTHPTPPGRGLEPPALPALSRPLWISPQALGREHTSQRLFSDKLPESLEDGEFLPGLARPPSSRSGPASVGEPGCRGREGAEGVPPPATAAQGGGKTEGVGEWGAGFPGAAGLESLPVP